MRQVGDLFYGHLDPALLTEFPADRRLELFAGVDGPSGQVELSM